MTFNNDNARTHCVNMEPRNYSQHIRPENRMENMGNYNRENHVRNNHNMHQHNPNERRNNTYGYESIDEYINLRTPNNGPKINLQEPLLRAQVVNIMQEMYGPELRKIKRLMFKKTIS